MLRALKTWAKAALSRANKTTRIVTSAKRLGAMLASPAYDAAEREWRKREIDCFVNVEKTTPLDDHETHEKALADVIDTFNTAPQGGNRRRIHAGPAELPIVPRNIILGRRAMLVAIENIDRFQAADLDLARHLILMDLREYLREQPRLAELSDAAAFYTSVTMAELLEGACGDLTRILGHAMLCPTRVREVLESSATHNSGPLRLRVKSLTGSLELDER
ncbi:MAG: hypothetical protein ACRDK7_16225 [Solirubrobacteraceae bacterium]